MQDPGETLSQGQVNKHIDAQIVLVGDDQTPVVVIDNFLTNFQTFNQYAGEHSRFSDDGVTYYPGVRADLPKSYLAPVLQAVVPQLYKLYQIPSQSKVFIQPSYFSLINKQVDELQALQKIPHFDTCNPRYFALLHYLNEGNHGGTGFFRHKPTGYECITGDLLERYQSSANAFFAKQSAPIEGYMTQSNAHFELISEIDYLPNRMLIYPGNLLHSGLLKLPRDIDANPKTGRLTANTFIEYQ